jgi:hypothetical protein
MGSQGSRATTWAMGLSCLISANVLATPAQHPKRLIGNYTVDLAPLFKWWTKHDGPRPLSSWVHITGSIVGTNAAGWIIEGQVEGRDPDKDTAKASGAPAAGSIKIILRSPPVEDLADFERLSSELTSVNLQRSSLSAEESDAKSKDEAVSAQQRSFRRDSARSRLLALEDRRLKQTQDETKAEQKPLDQRSQELKSKLAVYPNPDYYIVDCFALDVQYEFDRLPVYDHGRVMQ